ncbi:MAG: glycosyltransferase [Candidatus Schekmanbacteria bacterium]|nr:glycosyltransferase [Candidatus Schekmanbacteria bacterium]
MTGQRKFNLVRIISDLPVGGVERRLVGLLPKLKDAFNVSVVCIREKGALAHELEEQGIPVHLIHFKGRLHPASLRKLSKFLRENQTHIVHTHMYRPGISGTISAWLAGVPVVISNVHNVAQWDTKRQAFMDRLVNPIRDSVIAVSGEVKKDFIENTGLNEDKCTVIYNGVDTSKFRPDYPGKNRIIEEFKIAEGEKTVVNIARLVAQKDHLTFFKAAAEVIKKYPGKVRFLIVGGGRAHEEALKAARETGIEGNVIFTGRRNDIPEILSASDISVLSSLKEGFSNVILESMASGKPVVATDVGGNMEAIEEGETGFLVKAGDFNTMSDRILQLFQDENLKKSMGIKARKRAEDFFSIEKMIEKTTNLYFNLLKKKGVSS